jgi:predicted MPP superfamily phosphohydrolase
MKFQYFSDIHTEEYKSNPNKLIKIQQRIKVCAPYLILAGDIGDPFSNIYKDFIIFLSNLFEHIFIICGNHEYYTRKNNDTDWMTTVHNEIRTFTSTLENVTFLENEVFHISNTDISIFGATFWTDIKDDDENIIKYIADYNFIPNFTIKKTKDLHQFSCQKLQETLDLFPERKFVVISHHLPSYSLIDTKYLLAVPSLICAFASDINISNNKQIIAWIAGHTHTAIEQGKFHINPIGYKGQNLQYNFNKTIEI